MKSPFLLSIILSGAALTVAGCHTEKTPDRVTVVTSSGAKAGASLTPGKSTVADLRAYVGANLSSASASDGVTIYRFTESKPGPVREQEVFIIWHKNEPTTIRTTHNYKFVNGIFSEYWASEEPAA